MENIILTNNKDLRLVSVKVGVLSTLRFELPLVSASATHVEVIVTSGDVPSAYTATFIDNTKHWQCDIAASQFPAVGKQSYEVAYVLDGKQFWDGKGWIEIEDATTSGIEPQPRPEPYRYAVVSVNGYGADAQGAVRIPKTFITIDSPVTTEGYMEGDIYFNRETGATWTLCNVQGTLTWVFNYKNYYTKEETDQQIDRVAAYYITYNVQGDSFPTRAALVNAQTYYSGGAVRIPTRNDYANVLSDETHGGAQWRYIFSVPEGQTTGQWEPQYPIETNDYSQLSNKPQINDVTLSGNKTAADLGLATKADATLTERGFSEWNISSTSVDPSKIHLELETEGWVPKSTNGTSIGTPKGNAQSVSLDWTASVDSPFNITATRTALQGYQLGSQTDKPLQPQGDYAPATNIQKSALASDVQTSLGNADTAVQRSGDTMTGNLIVPNLTVGSRRSPVGQRSTASGSDIIASGRNSHAEGDSATASGYASHAEGYVTTASGDYSHAEGHSTTAQNEAEHAQGRRNISHTGDTSAQKTLSSIGFGTSGDGRRNAVETMQDGKTFIYGLGGYDGFSNPGTSGAQDLAATVNAKANRAANPTAGNLAALDASGNPTDSGIKPSDKLDSTSAAPAFSTSSTYAVGEHVTYNGALYRCTTAVSTAGAWDASKWTADTMTDPDAVLDISAQNQLRVVAKDGTLLWAQGYDLASTSSATLACDAVNNFTFADGATTQAFTLPTAPTGKVGDFGLDIDNSANTGAATMTLTGLDTTFSVVVPEGESLTDMLAIAAGELARFYISLSTFRVNNLPTWHIVKQVVENGGATA